MDVQVYDNIDQLSLGAAAWIGQLITDTLKVQDRFTLALSGGSTPQKLHEVLSTPPYKNQIEWSRVHFFWGDERCVPFNDERNNAKMAYDTLLNKISADHTQIHIMRTDIEPAAAALAYQQTLNNYFGFEEEFQSEHKFSFDLLLLGLGDDGHTLSLFPGTSVLSEADRWCTSFFLPQQKMHRITLTKTIANHAKHIAFLTAGAGKASALNEVLNGEYNPSLYPAQLIKPRSGSLHWFIDQQAAALWRVGK